MYLPTPENGPPILVISGGPPVFCKEELRVPVEDQ